MFLRSLLRSKSNGADCSEMMIILIGPMKVGKSTVARLLAERLAIPRNALDKNRWAYYKEIGYDEQHPRRLAESEGLDAALKYCKPFEVHAVERHLAEARDCIVDFGAGYSVQDDPALFERVRSVLAPHAHVVLLLPSPHVEESIQYLEDKVGEDLRGLNEHYLRSPANNELAKVTVYTAGKTPQQTCDDVLSALGMNV
jgi:shikimate kinase